MLGTLHHHLPCLMGVDLPHRPHLMAVVALLPQWAVAMVVVATVQLLRLEVATGEVMVELAKDLRPLQVVRVPHRCMLQPRRTVEECPLRQGIMELLLVAPLPPRSTAVQEVPMV